MKVPEGGGEVREGAGRLKVGKLGMDGGGGGWEQDEELRR